MQSLRRGHNNPRVHYVQTSASRCETEQISVEFDQFTNIILLAILAQLY